MRRWLRACSAFSGLLLWFTWVGRGAIEHTWWGALLLLAPPFLLLFPLALLALGGALARCRVTLRICFCTAVFVLLTFMGFRLGRASSERADLRVLSYNVYAGRMGVRGLIETLRAEAYDVALLQECRATPPDGIDPLAELRTQLPEWHWARSEEARELVIGSPHPLLSRGVSAGGTTLGEFSMGQRRPGLRCQINSPLGPVVCYNVHLSTSYGGTLASSGREFAAYLRTTTEIRRVQYEHLALELRKEKAPLLVGGDFNTTPPCSGPAELSSFLNDAFAAVGSGFGYTYAHRRAIWRIDYLYSSNELKPLRFRSWDAGASDHRAIRCDYRWQGPTSESRGSGSAVPRK